MGGVTGGKFSDSEIRTEFRFEPPPEGPALFLLRLILPRLLRVFELEKFVKTLWGNSSLVQIHSI